MTWYVCVAGGNGDGTACTCRVGCAHASLTVLGVYACRIRNAAAGHGQLVQLDHGLSVIDERTTPARLLVKVVVAIACIVERFRRVNR